MSKVDTQQPDVRIFFKRFIDNPWDWNEMADLLINLNPSLKGAISAKIDEKGNVLSVSGARGQNYPQWTIDSDDQYKVDVTEYVELMDGSFKTIKHTAKESLIKNGQFRPTYEPLLLEVTKGVVSVVTNINRLGNPGTATIKLFVPLSENNIFDKTLLAMTSYDPIYNVQQPQVEAISTHKLDILKPLNRRKSIFKPMDKVQIWFRKRHATTYDFPDDYQVAFTGLLDSANVSYGQGKIDISIAATDVLKWLSITRVNVSPSADPTFSAPTEHVIAFTSIFAGRNGSEIIKELILGRGGGSPLTRVDENGVTWFAIRNKRTGDIRWGKALPFSEVANAGKEVAYAGKAVASPWLGILDSNTEELIILGAVAGIGEEFVLIRKATKVVTAQSTSSPEHKTVGYEVAHAGKEVAYAGKEVFLLQTDFDKSKLLIPDALIGDWAPYKYIFSSFPLFQSDYRLRLDIAKEVADMTEFEFFADAAGTIQYRPPLYWLTPGISYMCMFNYKVLNPSDKAAYTFEPQYYIDDIDIIDDSFSESDKDIKTYVNVTGEYNYFTMENPQQVNTTWYYNPVLVNKFGVRANSKTLPTLGSLSSTKADKVRSYYTQSWLNRINAHYSSGNVTIVGTPELEIGRTVAFMGNIRDKIKSFEVGSPQSEPTTMESVNSMEQLIIKAYGLLPVYYIESVSHNYIQGKSFNTILKLTHGRVLGQRFGTGMLAYGVDNDDQNMMVNMIEKNIDSGSTEVAQKQELPKGKIIPKAPVVIPAQTPVNAILASMPSLTSVTGVINNVVKPITLWAAWFTGEASKLKKAIDKTLGF